MPSVHSTSNKRIKTEMSRVQKGVAMMAASSDHGNTDNDQKTCLRKSTRVRKQIKFVNGERKVITGSSVNNNATIRRPERKIDKLDTSVKLGSKVKSVRSDKTKCRANAKHCATKDEVKQSKCETKAKKAYNKFYDGVQISVNSDEELDFDDDFVDMMGEDDGSIDQDLREQNTDDSENLNEHSMLRQDQGDQHRSADGSSAVKKQKNSSRIGNLESTVSDNIGLGATSDSMNEEDMVMNNPHLRKLLNKMLDERIGNAKKHGETSTSNLLSGTESLGTRNAGRSPKISMQQSANKVIKSPSDTTIYAPALN